MSFMPEVHKCGLTLLAERQRGGFDGPYAIDLWHSPARLLSFQMWLPDVILADGTLTPRCAMLDGGLLSMTRLVTDSVVQRKFTSTCLGWKKVFLCCNWNARIVEVVTLNSLAFDQASSTSPCPEYLLALTPSAACSSASL